LYGKNLDLPHPSQTNLALTGLHANDGVIGSVSQQSKTKKKNYKKTQILALPYSSEENPSPEITSKINFVYSSTHKNKQSRGKKERKWKNKQNHFSQGEIKQE